MREPWIYTSRPHYSVSNDGKRRTELGIHAIYATEVPFIPSFLSADFVGPLTSGTSRLQLIVDRQIRFISDLAAARTHQATFDLRLIFRPPAKQGNQQPAVQLLFLGKAFAPGRDSEKARELALDLWRRFSGHFPLEDPFNYPLVPVDAQWLDEQGEHAGDARTAFESQVLMPIPLNEITADNLSEIRKFEDWDDIVSTTLGMPTSSGPGAALRLGYFVHHFRPTLDASALSRLLETLVQQQQTCLVRISLRPTLLTDVEIRLLNQLLSEYEHQLADAEGWIRLYKTDYLARMQDAFRNLITHRRHLFSINIQVVGEKERPDAVVAALGSEFMNNQSAQPQRIQEVRPRPNTDEIEVAKANLRYMEHELWGEAKGGPELSRIPILVSGYEAAGAFRLPIPPESGYMPGIPVRDEPFVQPQEIAQGESNQLSLGDIRHRGTKSGERFYVSLRDLRRHILIAGSTGSGKTNTCLHLLSQLWGQFEVPFLVIYPIAKPDYRLLMADPGVRDDLVIFTAGDRPSPLRFNPFDVPEGILLQTHISNMMRTFAAGMYMWGPLPSLFRKALRDLYRDHDWKVDGCRGDDPEQRIPTLADFYEKLKRLAGKWAGTYRADLRGDLRQDSEVKIHDLLETAGSVLNVRYADGAPSMIEQILERPTVIELGRVGSASDIALVVGFLVTLLGEHVFSRYQRNKQSLQHVTLIEEAHRLMSARVSVQGEHVADPRIGGAEDFAHVLSEVRGFGEAIMIAEQTPTKLIPDAIANTHVKIMHWLEDRLSFDLFAQMMNLNERQRQHARTLEVGEVIVRTASGYPVLVKVPFYEGTLDQTSTADEDVRAFMEGQIRRLGLSIPDYEPWPPEKKPASAESTKRTSAQFGGSRAKKKDEKPTRAAPQKEQTAGDWVAELQKRRHGSEK
jgi:hypothetical protein